MNNSEERIQVFIPKHSSSLEIFFDDHYFTNEANNRIINNHVDNLSHHNSSSSDFHHEKTYNDSSIIHQLKNKKCLIIQCRWEGVLWRGLYPILSITDKSSQDYFISSIGISILIRALLANPSEYKIQLISSSSIQSQQNDESHLDHFYYFEKDCINLNRINIPKRMKLNKKRKIQRERKSKIKSILAVFILPPNPILNNHLTLSSLSSSSSSPSTCSERKTIPIIISLHPERTFTSALVRLENIQIRLQTLNAYYATLGGGFFLCRYLTTAIQLAQQQRKIAYLLGDESLASKCTINEAYNYIHFGNIPWALHLIRKTQYDAKQRGDVLVVGMCKAARWFAKQVQRASLYEDDEHFTKSVVNSSATANDNNYRRHSDCDASEDVEDNFVNSRKFKNTAAMSQHYHAHSKPFSATFDDFQRIRIVRDRSRM